MPHGPSSLIELSQCSVSPFTISINLSAEVTALMSAGNIPAKSRIGRYILVISCRNAVIPPKESVPACIRNAAQRNVSIYINDSPAFTIPLVSIEKEVNLFMSPYR